MSLPPRKQPFDIRVRTPDTVELYYRLVPGSLLVFDSSVIAETGHFYICLDSVKGRLVTINFTEKHRHYRFRGTIMVRLSNRRRSRYIIKIEPAEEPNQFQVVEQVPAPQPPTPPAPRKRTRSIRKSIQEQNDKIN